MPRKRAEVSTLVTTTRVRPAIPELRQAVLLGTMAWPTEVPNVLILGDAVLRGYIRKVPTFTPPHHQHPGTLIR